MCSITDIVMTRIRFVFVFAQWCPTHIVLCFCFVFLRLVYPMLLVSELFLFCFSSSCVPYVARVWIVFVLFFFVLCTLCCSCLWIVHFLIAPSVFSNVYLQTLNHVCNCWIRDRPIDGLSTIIKSTWRTMLLRNKPPTSTSSHSWSLVFFCVKVRMSFSNMRGLCPCYNVLLCIVVSRTTTWCLFWSSVSHGRDRMVS